MYNYVTLFGKTFTLTKFEVVAKMICEILVICTPSKTERSLT